MLKQITNETINTFLNGFNPMKRIISIECGYTDSSVFIVYVDDNGVKRIKKEDFYPFVWAKQKVGEELYEGNRSLIVKKMKEYGIWSKGLITENEGKTSERLQNGYRVMFYAKTPMSYNKFMKFFNEGGVPIYGKDDGSSKKDFLTVSPVEQHMMRTGERMFKGYEDYDELLRLSFDLETEGLEPQKHSINQIGVRTNKGFEKIISVKGEGDEKKANELLAIREFLKIIGEIKPDIVTGQNSENFDWNFLIIRLEILGTSMEEESLKYLPRPIYKKKKQSVLKLGGEMEYYYPTVMWGFNITDSLHAIRRAQAIDSDMKKADLKYVTKYSNLNKPNRVYVPGDKIRKTWEDTSETYAFNDNNGKWFKKYDGMFETYVETYNDGVLERKLKYSLNENGYIVDNITNDVYDKTVTGTYIVERYLLDDLYETDKVELRYNQSNFLLGKLLPTSFSRVCTMGTAGTWKLIMLAWSYENDLAIPDFSQSSSFTGGLSRLLCVGYIDRVVKLDYNSLYPSIILTWNISTAEDIQGVMLILLEYILTQREKFKELKKIAGKNAEKAEALLSDFKGTEHELKQAKDEVQRYKSEESANDKKQLPFKIFGNSFFGGFGAPNIFNWGDLLCAENTTCNGRQALRLMIKWFTDKGYRPIVGDSFTPDTPLFIKTDENNYINIWPISQLIDERFVEKDVLGREYDASKKNYKVLCLSGWRYPSYIYRHKTNKDIYKISESERNMEVDVTEDHSLFDSELKKVSPKDLSESSNLKYYTDNIFKDFNTLKLNNDSINFFVKYINNGRFDRIHTAVLNADIESKKKILSLINMDAIKRTKTMMAGIQFLQNCIKNS